jgi:hypothetical protein
MKSSQQGSGTQRPPSTSSSTTHQSTPSSSDVNRIIQDSLKSSLDIEGLRIQAGKLSTAMNRYKSEVLSISRLNDSIIGSHKEMYDESCQTDYVNTKYYSDNDSEADDEKNNNKDKNFRKSAVGAKHTKVAIKKGFDGNEEKKAETNNIEVYKEVNKNPKIIISEETRKQIITSPEFNEFLKTQSVFIERVRLFVKL